MNKYFLMKLVKLICLHDKSNDAASSLLRKSLILFYESRKEIVEVLYQGVKLFTLYLT